MTSIGHGGSEVSSGAVHQLGGAKSVSLAIWFYSPCVWLP